MFRSLSPVVAVLAVAMTAAASEAGSDRATDEAAAAAEDVAVVHLADLGDASTPENGPVIRGQNPCDGPTCIAPGDCDGCDSGSCGCSGQRGLAGRGGLFGNGRSSGCPGGNCGCRYGSNCPDCYGGPTSKLGSWLSAQGSLHRRRNSHASAQLHSYLRCKFGYFCPSANCGQGAPLVTKYGMVYSLDPNYNDPRDAARYAAPGYGVHVNVPLAPNVRHSYNYSWGVPSSRLTPVRHGAVVGPPQPAHYQHTP